MQPVSWICKALAVVAHAVVAEYRQLDAPPPRPAQPQHQELSCTQARVESRWQPHARPPASPFGFRAPPRKE